jgi:hypothetical protein
MSPVPGEGRDLSGKALTLVDSLVAAGDDVTVSVPGRPATAGGIQ